MSVQSQLDDRTFEAFQQLVLEQTGIALTEQKRALLCARISKRMHALNLSRCSDYLDVLRDARALDERVLFHDTISTHVTSFFRESAHLDFLREHLPDHRPTTIWSAGCSTGEEPYSIAMALSERERPWQANFEILATDLSRRVIEAGRAGVYSPERLRSLPPALRARYFSPYGHAMQVRDTLRARVTFATLNLIQTPYPMHGPFDAIFCRNVMMYLDAPVRARLFDELRRLLPPGGLLFVGQAECVVRGMTGFESVGPSIFHRV